MSFSAVLKLRQFLVLFLIAAVYGTAISATFAQSPTATANGDPVDRVVIIGSYDEPKGTGYLVTPNGHILTAAHVIDRKSITEVRFRSKANPFAARIVKVKPYLDLALLKISSEGLPSPLIFSLQPPDVGGRVWLIGHHQKGGIIERFKSLAKSIQGFGIYGDIEIEGSVRPGFSGGPVLHPDGTVAGITLRNDITGTTYVLPTREIVSFLAGTNIHVSEMGAKPKSLKQDSTTGRENLLRGLNDLKSRIARLEEQLKVGDRLVKPLAENESSPKLAAIAGPLTISVQSLRTTRAGLYLTLVYGNNINQDVAFALYGDEISGKKYYRYPTYMIDDVRNEYRIEEAVGIGGLYYKDIPFLLRPNEKRSVALKFRSITNINEFGSEFSFISATAIIALDVDGRPKQRNYYFSVKRIHNLSISGIKITK